MELSANKKTRRVLAMCIAAILLVFARDVPPLVKFENDRVHQAQCQYVRRR